MKWVIIIFVGIFLISFVNAGTLNSSTTNTNFSISGCSFEFNNQIIGVATGTCSRGNASGYFYCDNNKVGWNTLKVGYGCSLGQTNYTLGESFCCPTGMFCNKTTGGFQCVDRIENCFDQKTESDCDKIGCLWMDERGICTDGTRDYSCSYYTTENSCNADKWGFGKTGAGTDLCGSHVKCNNGEDFAVPYDKCGCEWHNSTTNGQHCQVKIVGSQIFYNPAVGQDIFKCSSAYKLGNCSSGVQKMKWVSTNSVVSGFNNSSDVPQDCLDATQCGEGYSTRMCGEPIVKLPMFSLFSLFASMIIIGLFYFSKQINLNRVKH